MSKKANSLLKMIAVLAAGLAVAPQQISAQVGSPKFQLNSFGREKVIEYDAVLICSGFSEVTPSSIVSFVHENFGESRSPKVVTSFSQDEIELKDDASVVFFYADRLSSDTLLNCVEEFGSVSSLAIELISDLRSMKFPDVPGLEMLSTTPKEASRSTQKMTEGGFLVIFMSDNQMPYRSDAALKHLFGLQ